MALQFGEVVEGVHLVQPAGVDQCHEQIAHVGAVHGPVEQGILAMENRLLQGPLADIVVQGRARVPEEQGQGVPVGQQVLHRLAQTGVGLRALLLKLLVQPPA